MIAFFLLNALTLGSAFLLTDKFFRKESALYKFFAVFIIYYAQIIFLGLFWGLLGKLYLVNFIFSSLVIFACVFVWRRPSESIQNQVIFPVEFTKNKVIIFCLSVLLAFALVKIFINLVNPPFGWDSLNYHFTFPVEWLKNHNLQNPITINDDLGPPYYPINGSLIYFWFILPLANVFLADLGQIPFFAASFLAVYGISRALNVSKEYAFFSAVLFTITPNYFKHLEVSFVDAMVCGWFLLGLYFLILFYQRKKVADVVLFSLSLGLLVGTKTTALPYGAVLFTLFLVTIVIKKINLRIFSTSEVKGFLNLGGCFILILIFGGYGYIRNFFLTGNPFYPLSVNIFNTVNFKGVYDKSNYLVRLISYDYSPLKLLFHEGLGAGTLIFLIPGFFWFSSKMFSREKLNFNKLLIFVSFLSLCFIWRFIIPLANLRYLYPALGLGFVMPFYMLAGKNKLTKLIKVLVVLCVIASAFEISVRLELVASIVLSVVLFFSLRFIYSGLSKLKKWHWAVAAGVIFLILVSLNKNYNKNEFERYVKMSKYSGFWKEAAEAWGWINVNTKADNIAYVGRPVPFPLYGTNFKNNVFYVSVNKTEPALAHYFPKSNYRWGTDFLSLHESLEVDGNYREHPDYDVWLENLTKRKVDYLFIYSLHQTKEIIFPVEERWASGHREKFNLVFSNSIIRIYKIK